MEDTKRKAMIQQGFDTVAAGYTYMDLGVTGNAVCPWMDGSRTTHSTMDGV